MLRAAGFRQLLAAALFRFCCARSDAAGARRAVWEARAEEWRRYGEDA
jgi:hypothetical protein